jgi:hypothetical protein
MKRRLTVALPTRYLSCVTPGRLYGPNLLERSLPDAVEQARPAAEPKRDDVQLELVDQTPLRGLVDDAGALPAPRHD